MRTEMKAIALAFIALVFCVGIGFAIGYRNGLQRPGNEPEIKVDTLITRDTVYVDFPVPIDTVPAGFELVKVGTLSELKARLAALEEDADYWACNPDTVWLTLPLPIEIKRYGGDDYDYEAAVSGYHPNLDYIKVFPQTVTITTTQTVTKQVPPKWSISPFAGIDIGYKSYAARAGVLYDRQLRGGLRLYLGGGYEARNETNTFRIGPFVLGGIRYEFQHLTI